MLVAKFSCPSCGTVLKTGNPQPAGKMVKCPKCGADFAVAEGGADEPVAAAVHVGDDDADYRDGPNGRRKKDNTALILALVILLVAGLLAAGGGYLIWKSGQSADPKVVSKPEGLEVPKPVGVGAAGTPPKGAKPGKPQAVKPVIGQQGGNPLAGIDLSKLDLANVSLGNLPARAGTEYEAWKYVPADTNVVVVVDVASVMGNPVMAEYFEATKGTTPALAELDDKEVDHLIAALRLDARDLASNRAGGKPQGKGMFVAYTKRDYDPAKLLAGLKAEKAESGGKTYYKANLAQQGPGFVYMPKPRVLIIGTDDHLESVLALEGLKPAASSELISALKTIGPTHFALAASSEPAKTLFLFGMIDQPGLSPDLQAALQDLSRLNAGVFGVRLHDRQLTISVGATFPDQGTADSVGGKLQSIWNKQGKSQLEGLKLFLQGDAQGIVNEIGQNLKFTTKEQAAVATVDVTFKSIDSALKFVLQQFGGQIGPGK